MNELRQLAEEFVTGSLAISISRVWHVRKAKSLAQGDLRASVLSTLFILLDVCLLVELCESGQADKAIA